MLGEYFSQSVCPQGSDAERSLIKKIFEEALQGHLCTVIEEGELPPDLVKNEPQEALPSTPFCRLGKNYYLQKNWVLETRFLHELKRLLKPIEAISPAFLEGLNHEQQTAVEVALKNSLSIITGGPGTGKTFTAQRIVQSFLKERPEARVVLAAPTGKAASRLESFLPGQAYTLHSLLGVKASKEFIESGAQLSADLILVDECSMVDVALFSRLLAAVPDGARLILMGDGDQLPPVEAGSLFADLVESGNVPCVRLVQSLRSKQQEILTLAEAIKSGDVQGCMERVAPIDLWEEVESHFPGPLESEPDGNSLFSLFERFRILSCIRKGPLGVDTLNEAIFRRFWGRTRPGQWLAVPILITKNDRETGLYNGDTGVLLRCHSRESAAYAVFPKKKFALDLLPSFEYAYVLSVHKSQGSEYDKVALLVPTGSEVFGREVLYTAITRAKQSVLIDGDSAVIRAALEHSARRRSGLRERLT